MTNKDRLILEKDEIAKLLDNGQTQKHTMAYNDKGNLTEYIDPAGRRQVITYAANGYDVIGRSVQTDANGTLTSVSKVQYDANHRPIHIWDEAAAQTTIILRYARLGGARAGRVKTFASGLGPSYVKLRRNRSTPKC